MKCILIAVAILAASLSLPTLSQTSQPDPSAAATAKPSPASDALVKAAQESTVQQKTFDAALQTAKAALDAKVKDLQQQNIDLNQQLNTQIRADKKYKPMFEKIDAIQKQLAALNTDATNRFQQSVGSIQSQIATNNALIAGLVPIVRKENGWPDTATFDAATQTWKGITAVEEKK